MASESFIRRPGQARKSLGQILSVLLLLSLLLAGQGAAPAHAGTIYRVAWGGLASACGSDFGPNACELQYALGIAASGDELWVLQGTYVPTSGSDRSISFALKDGVGIYGGFDGLETLRTDRDPVTNVTTLSGDIGTGSDASDNSYHVVSANGVGSSGVLDGFTVTLGQADGGTTPLSRGGGMYNIGGSPTIGNVNFVSNLAHDEGGGMFNSGGSPELTEVVFDSNTSEQADGGGLYNDGTSDVTIIDGTFFQNGAGQQGGGFYQADGATSSTLTGVTFSGNWAGDAGGLFGVATLTNVTFDGNWVLNDAGGMWGSGTLTNVTFSQNTGNRDAGGMKLDDDGTLTNVIFTDNYAARDGGGLLVGSGATLILTDATFDGNSAAYGNGGGLLGAGTLSDVTFADNSALDSGGGMYDSGDSLLERVTFKGNQATFGGGMYTESPYPYSELGNVTFGGNSASIEGGGMFIKSSSPTLSNLTFAGNSALWGGGMFTSGSRPTIINSIFWNDSGSEIVNSISVPTIYYSIVSGGCPLLASCIGVTSADPQLGPLADNGGLTQTMALGPGSPAIDAGDDSTCADPPVGGTDQRGVARPQGAHCDIGAIEVPQATATFRSVGTQDGWILESSETSGSGGTLDAAATQFYLGDNSVNKQYRGILSFDTASLPDGAVMIAATLKVKKTGLVGADPFLSLGNIFVDVKNGSFSSNAALQLSDFKALASKNSAAKFTNSPVGGWYSAALSSSSLGYINRTGPTQFRLRFAVDDNGNLLANYLKFASGNAITSSRPQLILTYYVP